VTSERKIKANRANASSSTGPKTRHGRTRSATNALRHGLSLPIQLNQVLYEEARTLASRIVGPHASAYIAFLASRVAEAEIDLHRVRAARQQFLSPGLRDPAPEKLAAIVLRATESLRRMDRYERRARSRLKFAVRDFDEARSSVENPNEENFGRTKPKT